MKIRHSEPHGPLRASGYPAVGDQLDALLSLAQAVKEYGIPLSAKTEAWIQACQQVKCTIKKST